MVVAAPWRHVAPAAHVHMAMQVHSARSVLVRAACPSHVAMELRAERRFPSPFSAASACQAGGVNAARNLEWLSRPSARCLTAMARPKMAYVTRSVTRLLAVGTAETARWPWTRGHTAPTRTAGASSTTASVTKCATRPHACTITLTARPRRKSASKSLFSVLCISCF